MSAKKRDQLSHLSRKELEQYTKRLERRIEKAYSLILSGKPGTALGLLAIPA